MTKAEREYVGDIIENEGFHYAFIHYSDFSEIEDEEFHKLRVAYETAVLALEDYIG